MRVIREVVLGAAIAAVVTLALALVTFDPATVDDWEMWAMGIGASVVRSVASTVLATLGRRFPGVTGA